MKEIYVGDVKYYRASDVHEKMNELKSRTPSRVDERRVHKLHKLILEAQNNIDGYLIKTLGPHEARFISGYIGHAIAEIFSKLLAMDTDPKPSRDTVGAYIDEYADRLRGEYEIATLTLPAGNPAYWTNTRPSTNWHEIHYSPDNTPQRQQDPDDGTTAPF